MATELACGYSIVGSWHGIIALWLLSWLVGTALWLAIVWVQHCGLLVWKCDLLACGYRTVTCGYCSGLWVLRCGLWVEDCDSVWVEKCDLWEEDCNLLVEDCDLLACGYNVKKSPPNIAPEKKYQEWAFYTNLCSTLHRDFTSKCIIAFVNK